MKRSSLSKLGSVLFISIAVFVISLGFASLEPASAASSPSHKLTYPNTADAVPYRSEAMARNYVYSQVWPVNDFVTLSAADISAYRWEAMAKYYISHQASGNTVDSR